MLGIEHSHAPLLSFTSFSLLYHPLSLIKHLVGSAWLRRSKENRNEKSHPSLKRRTRHRRRRSAPRSLKRRRRANLRADKNPRADRTAVVTMTTTVMTVMTVVVVVPLAQGHPIGAGTLRQVATSRQENGGTDQARSPFAKSGGIRRVRTCSCASSPLRAWCARLRLT